jgi:hypothetical protein
MNNMPQQRSSRWSFGDFSWPGTIVLDGPPRWRPNRRVHGWNHNVPLPPPTRVHHSHSPLPHPLPRTHGSRHRYHLFMHGTISAEASPAQVDLASPISYSTSFPLARVLAFFSHPKPSIHAESLDFLAGIQKLGQPIARCVGPASKPRPNRQDFPRRTVHAFCIR